MLDHSSKTSSPASEDFLTELLRGLRLDGVDYVRCELTAPWGISFPAQETARFHFICGDCWLRVADGDWIELKRGDAVLLPRGGGHALASMPGEKLSALDAYSVQEVCHCVYNVCGGGRGETTILFCGSLRFNMDSMHPLLRMMPDVMRINALTASEPAIPHMLDAMAREVGASRVGSGGVLARLADVLAALIIRSWVEHGCGNTSGWVAAVRHPGLGRVIAAMHLDPEKAWTVDSLARLMGASRSGFAQQFASVVGETPARYLAQVRMHQARQWLTRDRMRISVVARRLGYDSEASFSRAFKRVIGQPPSHYRGADPAEASTFAGESRP
ncbi:helix-turn-helix domain-containing protein [Sinorhizobium medicae]|uniref:Helix-turn-helix domain-containing protein n=1 Tax=Sinorhizobium medicae TaxID=110321 RepID=A0A6G1WHL4_9HYPH|nr:AraC family transcriptional regulator [Sinorhizobium medicae]MBO1942668.1 AraC family transcriptional regulator [Sinorhizobium medicae]MDX0403469.1 helix-turn-helix domain-containing protein [Sinorhizobium medicae]MDX0409526.1 helix-turn-helix domain-containing protein [Sinorhizobium medicae]MDX0415642.1 helix-turn-helix domain-containing protein [Sinorhizobium medicae]MDX0421624.1 helix-turn-helix domain-containing protein [Sinorhizobium medicae]